MLSSRFHSSLRGVSNLTQFLGATRNLTAKAAVSNAAAETVVQQKPEAKIVVANKRNIGQSPFRMRFLAKLVRNAWVPDALAQMKFSPKHKAEDIAKIISRACALARINYSAIPEELLVKEIVTNKGSSYKKMRIMGRGRTGVGVIAKTHVTVKVEVIDFDRKILEADSQNQKAKWTERKELVQKLKAAAPTA